MTRYQSLALVLALALAAAGPAFAQDETADAAGDDPIVATVDGTEFRLSDLEASYQELPEQFRQMPLEMIYDPLIDRLVDGHLLLEAAEAQDIAADEAVQAAIERARADVLRQTLIERAVAEATTDEAVQAAYEERKAQPDFAVEKVTARHILVETAEEAEAVIEQLDGGADFAELAIEKSTDPAAATGGELGTFARGSMVPPFEAAAFAMEPGTYSTEPVQTQFGHHVILVEAKEATEPTLAEVEPELRAELTRGAIESLLEEVRADAVIERFALDGSAGYAEPGDAATEGEAQ
jgi:peptidyl-prolyl cis-trans isomerase C